MGVKRIAAFALLFIMLLQLCACSKSSEPRETAAEPEFSYTFTDASGTEVCLTKRPERAAVLFSSFAEIWTLAGGETAITVGEAVERGFVPEGAVLVDPSSGHSTIDLETLIASEPDLVIGTADYECQAEAVEFCRKAGIPAALFRVEAFPDYLHVLNIFCDINGSEEVYQSFGIETGERIDEIKEAVKALNAESPDILLVRAGSSERSTKAKTTEDHFACLMLSELGAVNIADINGELTGELSLEIIVDADPDYLFITTMGDETAATEYMNSKLESEGWRELSCVKNGNYCYLPKELFHFKPNARWAEAYQYLAEILYPELKND